MVFKILLDFLCLLFPPPALPNLAKSVGQGGVVSGAAKVVFFEKVNVNVQCQSLKRSLLAPLRFHSHRKDAENLLLHHLAAVNGAVGKAHFQQVCAVVEAGDVQNAERSVALPGEQQSAEGIVELHRCDVSVTLHAEHSLRGVGRHDETAA